MIRYDRLRNAGLRPPNNMAPAIATSSAGSCSRTMSTSRCGCCQAASGRGWLSPACCCGRPTRFCSTNRPTIWIRLEGSAARRPRRLRRHADVVSHDRYFVERLATKITEIAAARRSSTRDQGIPRHARSRPGSAKPKGQSSYRRPRQTCREQGRRRHRQAPLAPPRESREIKRADAETRRQQRADKERRARIDDLEARIAECENAIREIEQTMSAPGFYTDRTAAQPIIDQHQALMWKVGDLMHQWEELQSITSR